MSNFKGNSPITEEIVPDKEWCRITTILSNPHSLPMDGDEALGVVFDYHSVIGYSVQGEERGTTTRGSVEKLTAGNRQGFHDRGSQGPQYTSSHRFFFAVFVCITFS